MILLYILLMPGLFSVSGSVECIQPSRRINHRPAERARVFFGGGFLRRREIAPKSRVYGAFISRVYRYTPRA